MLNALATRTYATMHAQGFWDVDRGTNEALAKIALMHTELSEVVEEIRNPDTQIDEIYFAGPNGKPEGVPIELADLIIRVADFAGRYGIDLEQAIEEKQAYNATRPFRHGKTA